MQIRLRPEARLDIYEASRFYDRQSDGLGDKFVESIFEDMERLSQFAGIHSKLGRYFRILSQKFPFMICYDVNGEFWSSYGTISRINVMPFNTHP